MQVLESSYLCRTCTDIIKIICCLFIIIYDTAVILSAAKDLCTPHPNSCRSRTAWGQPPPAVRGAKLRRRHAAATTPTLTPCHPERSEGPLHSPPEQSHSRGTWGQPPPAVRGAKLRRRHAAPSTPTLTPCHPERSRKSAERTSCGVEGSLRLQRHPGQADLSEVERAGSRPKKKSSSTSSGAWNRVRVYGFNSCWSRAGSRFGPMEKGGHAYNHRLHASRFRKPPTSAVSPSGHAVRLGSTRAFG